MKQQPLHILLIADRQGTRSELKNHLGEGPFNEATFDSISSEDLEERQVDLETDMLILDDELMGSRSNLELLTAMRERYPSLPMILLTRKSHRQEAVEAMKRGATDFIFKRDLNEAVLTRAVQHCVERSEREEEIQKRNIIIDSFFDQSDNAIFLADLDQQLTLTNRVFDTLIDEEDPQKGFERFIREQLEVDHLSDLLDEYRVGEHTFYYKKDEEVRKKILTLRRIDYELGSWRLLGVIKDITDADRAKRDELTLEKLKLTERMARILAHEIRNPLTNVQLSVDYLNEQLEDNEELKMYIDIIERNAVRIEDLVSKILKSIKPFDIEPAWVESETFFKTILQKVEDRRELMDARIELKINEGCERMWIDAEKLELALLNLISNAFEAMGREGEPLLAISLRGDGDAWIIELEDNGKGMNEEDADHVFEAFYSKRQGGIGLGMTMVSNIIKGHGGTIEVDTKEGEGTCFVITLPSGQLG